MQASKRSSVIEDWKPAKLKYLGSLRLLSMKWLMPGMLISGVCNQQEKYDVLLIVGQATGWLNVLAAIAITWSFFRNKSWLMMVILGLLLSKSGRIVIGDTSTFLIIYTIFLAILFCAAGIVVASERPGLIKKQMMIFCMLSVPIMLLQLTGVSEWTQLLRTDFHGEDSITQFPTLFVDEEDLVITTFQARPAGFLYANNFLSLPVMFALGLYYGRNKTNKLTLNDMVLCAIVVLSMAKIVFLTLAVITLWILIAGDLQKKIKMVKVMLLLSFMIGVYSVFFPGVFAYNTSLYNAYVNFTIRRMDLSTSMSGDVLSEIQLENQEGDLYTKTLQGEHESGYAIIAGILPYLLIGVLSLFPLYLKRLRKLRCRSGKMADSALLILFAIALSPLAASFIEGTLYWFIAGFAFLPLFIAFKSPTFYTQNDIAV